MALQKEPQPAPGRRLCAYTSFLRRYRYLVLVFWTGMLVAGVLIGPRLLGATSLSLSPPSGTESAKAENALAKAFPSLTDQSPAAVVVRRTKKTQSETSKGEEGGGGGEESSKSSAPSSSSSPLAVSPFDSSNGISGASEDIRGEDTRNFTLQLQKAALEKFPSLLPNVNTSIQGYYIILEQGGKKG
jgi:hypothetical protein